MSETNERAALIAEAREYADAMHGGETEKWMRLVACVDNLATALADSEREQAATIDAALAYCARTDQGDWVISYHEAVQSLCAILSRSVPATEAVRLDPEPATVTFMGQPALNPKFGHAAKLPEKGEN